MAVLSAPDGSKDSRTPRVMRWTANVAATRRSILLAQLDPETLKLMLSINYGCPLVGLNVCAWARHW